MKTFRHHSLRGRVGAHFLSCAIVAIGLLAIATSFEPRASNGLFALWAGLAFIGSVLLLPPEHADQRSDEQSFVDPAALSQAVAQAIDAHFCVLDAEGTVLCADDSWNEFAERDGIVPNLADRGSNYLDSCESAYGSDRADAERAARGIEQVITGQSEAYTQLYSSHSAKGGRWFRLEVRPLVEDDVPPRRVVVTHFDVTSEELAQQELRMHREQSALLALVAKYTDNAVVITDARARIEWVNEGFMRITGYTLDEVRGRVPGDFLQGPDTDPATIEAMRRALRKKQGFNVEILNYGKDGRKYWLSIEVRPIHNARGEVTKFIAVQADVTQRRETEQHLRAAKAQADELVAALQESQRTLEYALFGAEVGLWQWNIETNEVLYSQRWAELLGLSLEQLNQTIDLFTELLHPEDVQRVWDAIEAHCYDPSTPYEADYRLRTQSGEYRWFHAKGRVIEFTPDGRPRLMAGTAADIHEKKLVEQQLERERLLLSSIVNTLPHAMFWKDRQSVYLGCNSAFAEHAGLSSPQEIAGKTDSELPWTPEETAYFRKTDAEVMESGKPHLNFEEPITGGDSTNKTILTSKVPLKDKNGKVTGILGIYHDITERKQTQMRQAQSQKLESIGQLAAGIAHEINTPMQFVYDNVEFLGDCLEKMFEVVHAYQQSLCPQATPKSWEERFRDVNQAMERCDFERIQRQVPEAIQESLDGLRRVVYIVRAIKQFSHPGTAEKALTDLNEAIQSTATISRNQWKYVADLNLELDPQLPLVECLPAELNQVFLNLIVNAADAVGEKCAAGAIDKGTITVRTRIEGDFAEIEVEDNGCGIPEHARAHVFVPFFTTKKIGQGSGQGLPIAYDVIVNKHGGTIDFRSVPGEGTVFIVRIPLRDTHLSVRRQDNPPEATSHFPAPELLLV